MPRHQPYPICGFGKADLFSGGASRRKLTCRSLSAFSCARERCVRNPKHSTTKMLNKRWSSVAKKAKQKEKDELEDTLSNLENAEPELCIKLLHFPSVQNFSGLKKKIAQCSEEWMLGFLDQDGLALLFSTLDRLSNERAHAAKGSIIASMELLHCVGCVKAVMNSRTGLDYVISKEDYTRMLSTTLDSCNVMVKKQVVELLAAMCIYSAEGKRRAIDAMEHYKHAKSQRYRFSVIVNELRSAENVPYQTAIMSFINAAILSTDGLHDRIHLRNEFIGLQLLDILSNLRHNESEDLLIQLEVFDEKKVEDEEELVSITDASGIDLSDHQAVFSAVFNKVYNTPQGNNFLTVLQCMLQLNPDDTMFDSTWEFMVALVQKVVLIESEEEGRRLLKNREVAVSISAEKIVAHVAMQTDFAVTPNNASALSTAVPISDSKLQTSGSVPVPPPVVNVPPPPPLGSVPPPPPLGGVPSPPPLGGVPPPPPLGGVPPPPPLGGVPPPPPLGGVPPPPPLGGIPPPPPLGGVPPPPPLGGIPPPPPIGGVPPPPPIGGVPPPPPIGGVPPPPPVGGIVPVYVQPTYQPAPVRRSVSVPKPTAKLRKFNWQKLPSDKIRVRSNSVWENMEHSVCNIEPNFLTIEELFSQKQIKKSATKETKKATPTEVTLVDSRRSLNINIFLKQFRLSNEAIVKALVEGNRQIMTDEKLRSMMKYLPEQGELELVTSFQGDPTTLGNVEKYFLQLSKVSHYALRIEASIIRETFEEEMAELVPNLRSVKESCKEIRSCKKLEDFLLLILKTGNYMNFGAYCGGAEGFKITSLLKLAETKANKPRMTLLHYVVLEAETKEPDLLELSSELATVVKSRNLSVEQLQKDTSRLSGVLNKLQGQVDKASEDLQKQFAAFLKDASERVGLLQKDFDEIESMRIDLANYLVEDEKKFTLEDCFSTFAQFANQVQTAIKDNKERAIAEEKRKKREAMAMERKASGKGKSKFNQPPPQENIIDNLLKDIRKGFKLKKGPEAVSGVNRKASTKLKSSDARNHAEVDGPTNANTTTVVDAVNNQSTTVSDQQKPAADEPSERQTATVEITNQQLGEIKSSDTSASKSSDEAEAAEEAKHAKKPEEVKTLLDADRSSASYDDATKVNEQDDKRDAEENHVDTAKNTSVVQNDQTSIKQPATTANGQADNSLLETSDETTKEELSSTSAALEANDIDLIVDCLLDTEIELGDTETTVVTEVAASESSSSVEGNGAVEKLLIDSDKSKSPASVGEKQNTLENQKSDQPSPTLTKILSVFKPTQPNTTAAGSGVDPVERKDVHEEVLSAPDEENVLTKPLDLAVNAQSQSDLGHKNETHKLKLDETKPGQTDRSRPRSGKPSRIPISPTRKLSGNGKAPLQKVSSPELETSPSSSTPSVHRAQSVKSAGSKSAQRTKDGETAKRSPSRTITHNQRSKAENSKTAHSSESIDTQPMSRSNFRKNSLRRSFMRLVRGKNRTSKAQASDEATKPATSGTQPKTKTKRSSVKTQSRENKNRKSSVLRSNASRK